MVVDETSFGYIMQLQHIMYMCMSYVMSCMEAGSLSAWIGFFHMETAEWTYSLHRRRNKVMEEYKW